METVYSALLVAAIVIVVLIVVARIFGDRYLLTLHEKNESQREKNKEEVSASVKEILNADREKIDLIIKQVKDQLKETKDDSRLQQKLNAEINQRLKQASKATEELHTSTEDLKRLLSNNRLRGDWGEQVAEDLLLGAGFVEKVNFLKQTNTQEGRPDFTVLLPDGTKLNVDVKFPLDDLIAYQSATTKGQKRESFRKFSSAVKEKIKQLSSKDYINPEAQTVDFVVMFVPNEMVFSFIYEELPDITNYANEKKVIMTGPFGFTAMLRLVMQAYKNFHYEQGLSEILGLVEKFQSEYDKFGESLEKVGRQIDAAQTAFEDVEGVRHRQLTRVVDKIGDYSSKRKEIASGDE